jgi:prepilin-type N-terminal cleavage/methylation domain-containing protein
MKRLIKRFARQFHSGEKGFTLIELLVVIAILGVIAAIVVPEVLGHIREARIAAAMAEVRTVRTAVHTAMARAHVANLTTAIGPGHVTLIPPTPVDPPPTPPWEFGHGETGLTLTVDRDLTITPAPGARSASVGEFIAGGIAALRGTYTLHTNGDIADLLAFSGLTTAELGTVRARSGLPVPAP